jgi:hypothetical protein
MFGVRPVATWHRADDHGDALRELICLLFFRDEKKGDVTDVHANILHLEKRSVAKYLNVVHGFQDGFRMVSGWFQTCIS